MKDTNFDITDFILNESFQRYVLNHNEEDKKYWEEWITENVEATSIFHEAESMISFIAARKVIPKNESISNEVFEKLLSQIKKEDENQIEEESERRFISPGWYIAASIIILVGLFFIFDVPGLINSRSQISQNLEIFVPKGQRSQMLLPDGTKVWLNSGTIFKYPSNFSSHKREVYLEGEAFFNVTHNKRSPFLVHIKNNLTVKVLGTEFNVKCYNDERVVETTLIKGSVVFSKKDNDNNVIKEVNLIPKEKVTYDKYIQKITVTKFDIPASSAKAASVVPVSTAIKTKTVENNNEEENCDQLEELTSWKDDALVFQDETFENISIKMERWFGIAIKVQDNNLKQVRFTGKFINKESVYQILDIINRSEPIQYTKKNNVIIISRKR